ncbi:DUF3649 domain-containing protein [Ottowia testudinis]|uniref:DUF3649 domain-containing protein n=1 Tax=Ottowia testudinis TaxID=2816950 RepID=A0A975CIT2_9BURK|nr:DUF3649 domain-containing protein [Ottowia testudinis]QTD46359.1 DUF3649 domain-containing protein [Ottowia testudinis]
MKKEANRRATRRYRLGVAARALAAIGGGYALSALASVALALWLPVARAEAVTWGLLAAFVVYPLAVMWVFAARSAARAWLGLALPAALLGLPVALHQWGWLARAPT